MRAEETMPFQHSQIGRCCEVTVGDSIATYVRIDSVSAAYSRRVQSHHVEPFDYVVEYFLVLASRW